MPDDLGDAADLPERLRELIADALASLWKDEHGRLSPRHRQTIYDFLGPLDASWGRYRRSRLAVLCARLVYPRWVRAYPGDTLLDHVLLLTEQVLAGAVDDVRAEGEMHVVWDRLLDPEDQGYDLHPGHPVLLCAAIALRTALGIDSWRDRTLTEDSTDEDFEMEDSDAPCWAHVAQQVDPSQGTSLSLRLRFWTWWLTRAVPQVWQEMPSEAP